MSRYRARFDDPHAQSHPVPTFWWLGAPAGYATIRQLRDRGLRPGGQPIAAQILWHGVGGERAAYLYRIDLAKPKRTATPAQQAAIAKALRTRRTCATCSVERDYYIPTSLGECLVCAMPELYTNHTEQEKAA